jgi:hypothetical protein
MPYNNLLLRPCKVIYLASLVYLVWIEVDQMYRRSRKYQAQISGLAAARAAKERKRLSAVLPDYPPDLPDLRRVIEITDYDSGTPTTHVIELYRSDRIDCYNVKIDGKPWQERIGWSRILEGLRKALPRIRQLD